MNLMKNYEKILTEKINSFQSDQSNQFFQSINDGEILFNFEKLNSEKIKFKKKKKI